MAMCLHLIAGCHESESSDSNKEEPTAVDSIYGRIEVFDATAYEFLDTSATLKVIGRGYDWSEGPVWIPSKQMLLFSDVLQNKIYQWSEDDSAKVFLFPSGYTDKAARDGENGSNGLTIDQHGSLLLCQSGNRQVAMLSSAYDKPLPVFRVLSSGYKGKKFNSPNDLVTDRAGNIYFTDPVYGLPLQANDPTRELNFEGVYKIDTTGNTTLLIDSISRPNGIAFSPDEKTLYVASSDSEKPRWYAYRLNQQKKIIGGGILVDATSMKKQAEVDQRPDGMKVDNQGHLFCSGPDGINVFSPAGKRLALIRVHKRRTSNCAFDENKKTLYMTADDLVLSIRLK